MSGYESIRTKIGEEMKGLAPKVEEAVVESLAKREKDRRVDACLKVWDQLDKTEKELLKVNRADVISYNFDAEGKKETYEAYSPGRVKDIERLQDRITKIKKALNQALDKSEFKDVYDLANAGASKGSDAKSDGEDKEAS